MSRLPPLMVLWIMCLAAVLPGHVSAASITNYFGGSWDWPLHTLTINVGDTVLWINQQPRFIGSNYVETFTGEFKSPLLDEGNSFSFTFTKSGFYAYRTGTHKHAPVTPGTESNAGTVIVNAWTGAPPAITINFPYENAVNETHLQASVTNEPNTVEVQYFTNSVFAGSAEGQRKRSPLRLWASGGERQGEVASSFFGGTSSRESGPVPSLPFTPFRDHASIVTHSLFLRLQSRAKPKPL